MTGFDYIVLLIVGIAAAGGFMRGFLQEVLSLAAWVLAAFAIRALHTPLTLALQDHIGTDITTARSYELVDASSRSLVEVLAERRARLREQAADGA